MKQVRKYTRREFICAGVSLVSGVVITPAFLSRTLWALQTKANPLKTAQAFSQPEHILVVVQLGGGNDGLNTVIPFTADEYYKSRETLAIPQNNVLKLSDSLGLNPEMTAMRELYEDQMLAVIQGVGYPNPNRSHFRSMDIWHTAKPEDISVSTGWLGRFFDNACKGMPSPSAGVQFGVDIPLALKGETNKVVAISNLEEIGWKPTVSGEKAQSELDALDKLLKQRIIKDETLFVAHTEMDTLLTAELVEKAIKRGISNANYPATEFGEQLKGTAMLISGEFPAMVYYVHLGGFDTHANQAGRHNNLLREFSEGIKAFFTDLKVSGHGGRVICLVFSEFGRRLEENASGGTDHGTVNPVFLLGERVRPGLHGKPASLKREDLDEIGDPKFTVDFRQVYATVLEDWLIADSFGILGSRFSKLDLVES